MHFTLIYCGVARIFRVQILIMTQNSINFICIEQLNIYMYLIRREELGHLSRIIFEKSWSIFIFIKMVMIPAFWTVYSPWFYTLFWPYTKIKIAKKQIILYGIVNQEKKKLDVLKLWSKYETTRRDSFTLLKRRSNCPLHC